jgi:hypothetical protein
MVDRLHDEHGPIGLSVLFPFLVNSLSILSTNAYLEVFDGRAHNILVFGFHIVQYLR